MKTILVVEDNQDIRQITAEGLRILGYNVLEASNGEEGLEIIKTCDVDAIFTDIVMPGKIRSVDMVQIAKEELCKNVKVLYTSGYPNIDRALVGEYAHVLPKPYKVEDLHSMLEQMLAVDQQC